MFPRKTISPTVSPSAGTSLARLRVDHGHPVLEQVAHALPPVAPGAGLDVQLRPGGVLGAHRGGPVRLGQPVDVGEVDPEPFGALEGAGRRRRGRDHRVELVVERRAQLGRGVEEQVVDDGRAAVVRHAVLRDQPVDRRRVHGAEADVRPGVRRHRPGEAPAVAVEHRQRPQVDAVPRHVPGDDVADRGEVGAAVVDDDALRVARRARGVVERDGLPLVGRFARCVAGVRRTRAATRTPARRSLARRRCTRSRRRPPRPAAAPARATARAARAAKARSTSRTFASECSRMNVIAAASRRVLIGTRTAPVIGTPKWASIISGVFASRTATVSPRPMPRVASAEASRRHRSRVALQLYRRAPCTTARLLGVDVGAPVEEHQRRQGSEVRRPAPSPASKSSIPTGPSRVSAPMQRI